MDHTQYHIPYLPWDQATPGILGLEPPLIIIIALPMPQRTAPQPSVA